MNHEACIFLQPTENFEQTYFECRLLQKLFSSKTSSNGAKSFLMSKIKIDYTNTGLLET